MKRPTVISLQITPLLCLCCLWSEACTTFCFRDKDHLIFAKNFDFYMGDGHILVNKRSISKTSFPLPGETSIRWTSKYGSITFNQLGREFPFGGMNEKGLVVEQMYLADAGYPESDQRAGIAELQWIQYQLDNSATVDEVIATDAIIRISKYSAPIHFLICDAKGNVASFEYVSGKLVVRKNADLTVCALTNDTYALSMDYFQTARNKTEDQLSGSSFDRFTKTGKMLERFESKRAIDYSFELLSAVAQSDFTRWSIVYDVRQMTIHFETANNPKRRSLVMREFDFACSAPVVYADIDYPLQRASDLKPYSAQENAAIIQRTFQILATKPLLADLIPKEDEQRAVANYPETTYCRQEQ